MSRLFGPLRQMGFVVFDVERAMRHWVEVCGVGPWFHARDAVIPEFTYRGTRQDGLRLSLALANSGEVQVELIQQLCDTPSMFRDFLATGREGLQHWAAWPEDYDGLYRRALAGGLAVAQEGVLGRGRFAYLATEGHPGTVVEIVEPTPARLLGRERIRAAALGWDGTDPVRPY